MKCLSCGGEYKITRESHRYLESGLSNVILLNLEVRRCPGCGEHELVIPKIEQLHRLIGRILALKKERLQPEEIRFLRKSLGWSGIDLADRFGVAPETVSRWETGQRPMNPVGEKLLRVLVAREEPIKDYSILSTWGSKSSGKPKSYRLAMAREWQLKAA